MPQPVSYNPGTPVSGSIQENNISYVVDGQQRDYRGGFGGLSWMSEVPAVNNVIFIGNSTSLGRGPANIPLFYPSFNNTEANIVYTVNTLPGSPGNFTTSASAYNWAVTNNFFINNSDNPIPRIDADGLSLYIDASQPTSYPQTASTWYDLSGNNNSGSLINGPTFDSNGYFTFDGSNDYVNFGSSGSALIQGKTNLTIGLTFQSDTNLVLRGLFGTLRYGCGANLGLVSSFNNLVFYNDYGPSDGSGTCYAVGFSNYVTASTWIYAVATYDGTTTRVYGIKQGTLSLATGTNKSGSTNIFPYNLEMGRGGFGQPLTGKVANAFIYNRALTQQEILQNYYQAPIVTDGLVFAVDPSNLVSYESGSTTTYSLTGSITGSLQNGTGFNINNGGVWVFDGVDDTIYYGFQPINFNPTTQPFSMGGWINLSSTIGSGDRAVLLDIGGTSSARLYIAIDKNNLRFVVDIRPPAGTTSVPVFGSINSISLGEWVHGMVTFDGGTIKLYQNGELIRTATGFTNYPTSLNNWYSGHQDDNNHYMNGYISSVFLYLKTLTPEEVSQNFNAQRSRFGL